MDTGEHRPDPGVPYVPQKHRAPGKEKVVKVAGIAMMLWAYTFGSWGYILVKGYNITFLQWVDPIHPYGDRPWPPKCVPPGFLFPTTKAPGVDCAPKTPGQRPTVSNSPTTRKLNREAQQAGRPGIPGSVPGHL